MNWDQLAITDLIWVLIFWCLCGIPGAIVGGVKNAGKEGLLLGTLFGPLGVIAAFTLDKRPKCESCSRRIDSHELWLAGEAEKSEPLICEDCRNPDSGPELGTTANNDRSSDEQNTKTCPDCNGSVSRRVQTCPHCGCPVERTE